MIRVIYPYFSVLGGFTMGFGASLVPNFVAGHVHLSVSVECAYKSFVISGVASTDHRES